MMSRVVWDQAALRSKLEYAEKKIVAVGLQLERDIKLSISGPGPAPAGDPPGVDTGRLRASISTNWSGSGMDSGNVGSQALTEDGIDQPERRADKFVVRVGSRVEYASWLEWGTRKMAARPFIRPSLDRLKIRIQSMITSSTGSDRG
jgi:HK97 gp10 family phage protein